MIKKNQYSYLYLASYVTLLPQVSFSLVVSSMGPVCRRLYVQLLLVDLRLFVHTLDNVFKLQNITESSAGVVLWPSHWEN